jgi:hypothetical protein
MAQDAGACSWCKEFLKIGGRRPMARYRCCFLDERDVVVSIEQLESFDDPDAHRDVMALLARTTETRRRNSFPVVSLVEGAHPTSVATSFFNASRRVRSRMLRPALTLLGPLSGSAGTPRRTTRCRCWQSSINS